MLYNFIIRVLLTGLDPGSLAQKPQCSTIRPSSCWTIGICNVYNFDSYYHILNIFEINTSKDSCWVSETTLWSNSDLKNSTCACWFEVIFASNGE